MYHRCGSHVCSRHQRAADMLPVCMQPSGVHSNQLCVIALYSWQALRFCRHDALAVVMRGTTEQPMTLSSRADFHC